MLPSQAGYRESAHSLREAPWSLGPWLQLGSGLYHPLGKIMKPSISFSLLGPYLSNPQAGISVVLTATLSLYLSYPPGAALFFSGKFELLRSVTPDHKLCLILFMLLWHNTFSLARITSRILFLEANSYLPLLFWLQAVPLSSLSYHKGMWNGAYDYNNNYR